jgi:hypothetical protein
VQKGRLKGPLNRGATFYEEVSKHSGITNTFTCKRERERERERDTKMKKETGDEKCVCKEVIQL